MYEFHVSRFSRDRYEFDRAIYQLSGNVVLADFAAARSFSDRINAVRDLVRFPETAVTAGEIHAMGLIDEILHIVVADYRKRVDPELLSKAIAAFQGELGAARFEQVLGAFTGHFPPVSVYQGQITAEEYLADESGDVSNREIALEELLMLWVANANPAFARHVELFDDRILESETAYRRLVDGFDRFFKGVSAEAGADGETETLLDVLLAPGRRHPDSLTAQLEYLMKSYPVVLEKYQVRALRSLDLLREEQRPAFTGPGPVRVVDFARMGLEAETEQFSPDLDWMPRLVLVAKNAHVWLDQLSKSYRREIHRLDQIPQEELDELSRRGFTGLWLIGLWERSPASKSIKNLTGNPDAVSSAYSLFDYAIAADLGGDPAYEVLRDRAAKAGIRLAADMVPNHTGIYSRWVLEHPEWFISVEQPPYPAYSFEGPDLSSNPTTAIVLEDHYYSRTDAAVVFKRVDRRTGQTRYIYHGNDGTSMPWNDTAQLDYLNPEVREAVIRTIIGVARKFSVIRFDAAMTLAKKHIQRLWFPEPGQGGAIPSRSEHGLTARQFEAAIPNEFWREVVDRVAAEAPDTLLLAEAFWLMEGYFVRTLGMHRVYNSAFMHMLRDEKNAEYRSVIKNTLEFDPQILKRYVNFMNNPDEATAVAQFGNGGKYFGVCTLLATLPGLPMFGHGQVEGFQEKYGMEYQRAYYDEIPDAHLVERHRREIFPLLHRRAQFAEVDHFLLYDFVRADGFVDENVFAYSNIVDGERSLVLYHNRWGETRGSLIESTGVAVKTDTGKNRARTEYVAAGLAFPEDSSVYVIFRDAISGLEYIRSCEDLHAAGFEVDLGGYEYRVYLDFRLVSENEWSHYRMLTDTLGGRGVRDLEAVRQEIVLEPILDPWRRLFSDALYELFLESETPAPTLGTVELEQGEMELNAQAMVSEGGALRPVPESPEPVAEPPEIAGRGLEADEAAPAPDVVEAGADAVEQEPVEPLELEIAAAISDPEPLETALETAQEAVGEAPQDEAPIRFRDALQEPLIALLAAASGYLDHPADPAGVAAEITAWFEAAELSRDAASAAPTPADRAVLYCWLTANRLGLLAGDRENHPRTIRGWLDDWLLGRTIRDFLSRRSADPDGDTLLVSLLVARRPADWLGEEAGGTIRRWLGDAETARYLNVNRYQGIVWFDADRLDRLTTWVRTLNERFGDVDGQPDLLAEIATAAANAGYQVDALLAALDGS